MTLDREARTIGWVVRAGTTRGYGWYLCDGALESVDGMVWGPKSSSYVYKTQREALADADERVEETRLVRVLRKPPSDTAPTIAALTAERDEARVRTTVVEARVRVVEFERDAAHATIASLRERLAAAQREADAWQSKCKETEKGRDEWPQL